MICAKDSLKEQNATFADKQKRALSFESLYAEGVVSRRELEQCKKEAKLATQELEDVELSLKDLHAKSTRLDQRLKDLLKTKMADGNKRQKRTR